VCTRRIADSAGQAEKVDAKGEGPAIRGMALPEKAKWRDQEKVVAVIGLLVVATGVRHRSSEHALATLATSRT
jgi:hypothetical protein